MQETQSSQCLNSSCEGAMHQPSGSGKGGQAASGALRNFLRQYASCDVGPMNAGCTAAETIRPKRLAIHQSVPPNNCPELIYLAQRSKINIRLNRSDMAYTQGARWNAEAYKEGRLRIDR